MSNTQYQQYGGNPYQYSPAAEAGYGGNEQHEMATYSNNSNPTGPDNSQSQQQQFLGSVKGVKARINDLDHIISQISTLRQRQLSSPSSDPAFSQHIEGLETQLVLNSKEIRDEIRRLEEQSLRSQSSERSQIGTLKNLLRSSLEKHQAEETKFRAKYSESFARQYKIANPSATQEEIHRAEEEEPQQGGVFQNAILNSGRSDQANTVLGSVHARHNDIARIEKTLTEIAVLFEQLNEIVVAQDPVVERTEENAIKTAEDVDKGNLQIDKANEHARRRNRLKWWCLLVTVIIILAIALGVGLGVGLAVNSGKGK